MTLTSMNSVTRFLSWACSVAGSFLLFVLVAVCFVNIVFRYFKMPITASYDFLSLFEVFMLGCCLVVTQVHKNHIVVSMFTLTLLSNMAVRRVFTVISSLINIIVCLWLATAIGYHLLNESIPNNELAMTMGISVVPFRVFWGIGWLLLAVFVGRNLIAAMSNSAIEVEKAP